MKRREQRLEAIRCIKCGRKATEGSMKYPVCKKCYKKYWNNNYQKYFMWVEQLETGHPIKEVK